MKLLIKLFGITPFEIEIDKKESILELKYKIQKQHKIDIEMQRLIYKGYPLLNNYTLESLNIIDGSIIHLILMMKYI